MRPLVSGCLVLTVLTACHDASKHPVVTMLDMGMDAGTLHFCDKDSDCDQLEYCRWELDHACGRDGTPGECILVPQDTACPSLAFYVCGCDNYTYVNECFTHISGISVDYGGPCRSGAVQTCHASSDCTPQDELSSVYCVDDPRDDCTPDASQDAGCSAADGGVNSAPPATCPGICVHANYPCTTNADCASVVNVDVEVDSPNTQACISTIDTVRFASSQNPICAPGWCVFASGTSCVSQSDCHSPDLCMPVTGCDPNAGQLCPSVCVRP